MSLAKAFFMVTALMVCEPLEAMESDPSTDVSAYALSTVTSSDVISEYQQPTSIEQMWQMVELRCPCCGCIRYFPSQDFFDTRLALALSGDEETLAREVTNYVGDIVLGRYCRFCGAVVTE